HGLIVAKRRCRGSDFSPHVADRTFSGTRHGFRALAEILDNAARSTFYGKDTRYFQDDVLRRGPTVEFTGQFYANQFRELKLPREPCHDIARIRTADTDGQHTESAGVHGM